MSIIIKTLRLRQQGMTFKEIASEIGFTPTYARQLYQRATIMNNLAAQKGISLEKQVEIGAKLHNYRHR